MSVRNIQMNGTGWYWEEICRIKHELNDSVSRIVIWSYHTNLVLLTFQVSPS